MRTMGSELVGMEPNDCGAGAGAEDTGEGGVDEVAGVGLAHSAGGGTGGMGLGGGGVGFVGDVEDGCPADGGD